MTSVDNRINIRVEATSMITNRREWDEKMTSLKAQRFPMPNLGARKTMERSLRDDIISNNVDRFLLGLDKFMEEKKLSAVEIIQHPSPNGSTLLHVAAGYGNVEVTRLLTHHFPYLATLQNYQGDTSLHTASRAKQKGTVEVLIDISKTNILQDFANENHVGPFLRMKNDQGNSALHEALLVGSEEVAKCLIEADPELCYDVNNEHKSPLYLAVELACHKEHKSSKINNSMISLLLQGIINDDYSLMVGKLRLGKSIVNAALRHDNLDVLEEIKSKKRELLNYVDINGKTPLHYAASRGNVDALSFLLDVDKYGALAMDKDGIYPIHEACENGHVEVVRALLAQWPDSREFITKEGHNIFHVAAANGRENLVKELLRAPELKTNIGELVNQKDKHGDTPLHLATSNARSIVVFRLVWSTHSKSQLKNNKFMTAYNIAVEQSNMADTLEENETKEIEKFRFEDDNRAAKISGWKLRISYERLMALSILQYIARSPLSDKLRIQVKAPTKEEVAITVNNLLVVATLIAGITFSTSVQIPGAGDYSKNHSAGDDSKNKFTNIFVFSTAIAMNTSIIAAIMLCWAQLSDINIASLVSWGVSYIIGVSFYAMCFAYLAAALTVVSKTKSIAWAVSTIQGLFLIAHAILLVPLLLPSKIKQILFRIFYLVFFVIYYTVVCCWKKCCCCFRSKKP